VEDQADLEEELLQAARRYALARCHARRWIHEGGDGDLRAFEIALESARSELEEAAFRLYGDDEARPS
jgi:hypothetical protein